MCATNALADTLLLDNFNGAGNPNLSDINYNLAARQAGSSLGTATWTAAGAGAALGHAFIPDGLLVAGDGGSTSGWASPDHVFSGAECAGGLVIEFDIDPQHKSPPSPAWLTINLGMTAANRWTSVNGTASHLGLNFHDSNVSEIYDGSTQATWFNNGVPAGVLTHVRLELTDSTDGNPLDGVGLTTLAVYIAKSPTPSATYTKAGGGLVGGYIAFQASAGGIGLLDNLAVYQLTATQLPAVEIATYAGVSITGMVGRTYGIQASTTMEADRWFGVGNVTLTSATQIWYDTQSTAQQPKRFYRVVPGKISIP